MSQTYYNARDIRIVMLIGDCLVIGSEPMDSSWPKRKFEEVSADLMPV